MNLACTGLRSGKQLIAIDRDIEGSTNFREFATKCRGGNIPGASGGAAPLGGGSAGDVEIYLKISFYHIAAPMRYRSIHFVSRSGMHVAMVDGRAPDMHVRGELGKMTQRWRFIMMALIAALAGAGCTSSTPLPPAAAEARPAPDYI